MKSSRCVGSLMNRLLLRVGTCSLFVTSGTSRVVWLDVTSGSYARLASILFHNNTPPCSSNLVLKVVDVNALPIGFFPCGATVVSFRQQR
ncbi:hypothetical protein V6N11_009758 [Hibiscus sabdariffa]|uniref:Uncharacterized protein n=2 Tax=Hibiscus sabdariffa TaxID=183260 RepID=A0ABR2AN69_9ROSI